MIQRTPLDPAVRRPPRRGRRHPAARTGSGRDQLLGRLVHLGDHIGRAGLGVRPPADRPRRLLGAASRPRRPRRRPGPGRAGRGGVVGHARPRTVSGAVGVRPADGSIRPGTCPGRGAERAQCGAPGPLPSRSQEQLADHGDEPRVGARGGRALQRQAEPLAQPAPPRRRGRRGPPCGRRRSPTGTTTARRAAGVQVARWSHTSGSSHGTSAARSGSGRRAATAARRRRRGDARGHQARQLPPGPGRGSSRPLAARSIGTLCAVKTSRAPSRSAPAAATRRPPGWTRSTGR